MGAEKFLDTPRDYAAMWKRLGVRLDEEILDSQARCLTENETNRKMRQFQGQWAGLIIAHSLLDEVAKEYEPKPKE